MGRFNLTKLSSGERFIIDKTLGLNNIRVELTWQNGDLDAQAWLLNADGLIVNDAAFVFYNSKTVQNHLTALNLGIKPIIWLQLVR